MEKNKIIKIVIGVVVIGIAIAGVWLYRGQSKIPQGEVIKATFTCVEGKIIEAEFDNLVPSDTKVRLKLSDGRNLTLPRAISGSGARYANADESIVFWNKGDTAFITEKDIETYSNCVVTE